MYRELKYRLFRWLIARVFYRELGGWLDESEFVHTDEALDYVMNNYEPEDWRD